MASLDHAVVDVDSFLVVALVEGAVGDAQKGFGVVSMFVFAVALQESQGGREVPFLQVVGPGGQLRFLWGGG
jgi:hypothetical protein